MMIMHVGWVGAGRQPSNGPGIYSLNRGAPNIAYEKGRKYVLKTDSLH